MYKPRSVDGKAAPAPSPGPVVSSAAAGAASSAGGDGSAAAASGAATIGCSAPPPAPAAPAAAGAGAGGVGTGDGGGGAAAVDGAGAAAAEGGGATAAERGAGAAVGVGGGPLVKLLFCAPTTPYGLAPTLAWRNSSSLPPTSEICCRTLPSAAMLCMTNLSGASCANAAARSSGDRSLPLEEAKMLHSASLPNPEQSWSAAGCIAAPTRSTFDWCAQELPRQHLNTANSTASGRIKFRPRGPCDALRANRAMAFSSRVV